MFKIFKLRANRMLIVLKIYLNDILVNTML